MGSTDALPRSSGLARFRLPAASVEGGRFVIRYLRPYRWKFLVGLTALFASSLAGLAFPAMTGWMIDATTKQSTATRSLNEVTLLLLGVLFLQSAFGYLRAYLNTEVAERVISDLRQDLYNTMIRLPMTFFHTNRVGDLTSRLGADVGQIQFMITTVVAELLRQSVIMIGGIVLVSITSFRLTLIIVTAIPIVVLLALTFGRMLRKAGKQIQDLYASLNTVAEETFQGIAVVKSFTAEERESARYSSTIRDIIKLALKIARGRGAFTAFVTFVLFGGVVGIIWYGGRLVLEGGMSIGDLTSFVLYALFVGAAMGSFADLYASFQGALGASERIRGILQEPVEELPSGSTRLDLRGDVELRDVIFSYPTRPDVVVLNGISLSVPAGSSLALVGASGAGKSTVAALLMRFYEPVGGVILVDGRPASEYPLGDFRSSVAIVPQDVLLFGGTIRENIAYGVVAATDAEVERAAQLANAEEFIKGFPDGYNTIVGERGVQLSGGQRQRIAIARAILKDPAILILDEATSSLDAESEQLVQEALQRVMHRRTTLVIAHRLSTIRHADAIAVIARGTIIEQGTFESLTSAGGIFARLVALQNRAGSDLIDEVILADRTPP